MHLVSSENFLFDDSRMYPIIKKSLTAKIKFTNNSSLLTFETLKKCINLYLYLFPRKDIDVILSFVY